MGFQSSVVLPTPVSVLFWNSGHFFQQLNSYGSGAGLSCRGKFQLLPAAFFGHLVPNGAPRGFASADYLTAIAAAPRTR